MFSDLVLVLFLVFCVFFSAALVVFFVVFFLVCLWYFLQNLCGVSAVCSFLCVSSMCAALPDIFCYLFANSSQKEGTLIQTTKTRRPKPASSPQKRRP